ncbi:MAG: hypothetical protein Q9217_000687 [Psora testacea]
MASNLQKISLDFNRNYRASGLKSYVYLLNKYKFAPTKEGPYFLADKAHTYGINGDDNADDEQNDSLYLCPVTIGTPGQTFNLDFDTGSADLWIAYGDGSTASGDVGTENAIIGGLTIESQAVELAKQLSPQFASGLGHGLLGLAFGSISTVTPGPVKTPVEEMIAQSDIPKESELFTAYLSNYKNSSDTAFCTFGSIDHDAGKTIARSGNTAIADTGTTLALVDDTVCQAVYDAIRGGTYDSSQQGYVFPSDTNTSSLPDVSYSVGDRQFSINKQDLGFADAGNVLFSLKAVLNIPKVFVYRLGFVRMECIYGNGTYRYTETVLTFLCIYKHKLGSFSSIGLIEFKHSIYNFQVNSIVYSSIQSRGDLPFDILGDAWLKGVYAIFDQGKMRFGLVQRTAHSS